MMMHGLANVKQTGRSTFILETFSFSCHDKMFVVSLHYFPPYKFIYIINNFLAMIYTEMTTKNTVG